MSGTKPFEIGIFTFGELTRDAHGQPIDAMTRTRDILEWARVADEAGLDVFGVGEHHREDFAVSSPAVVLAAAAAQTKNIRLTSTVTVLSSSDPVRVFEDFATLDLISGGRAEITAGRGAYVESFPLFGQKLERYDEYFEDRLDLLLRIREENPITWNGTTRAPLTDAGVWPRPVQAQLPIWAAVGGTPSSVERAGRLGMPLYLAILGAPERFGRWRSCIDVRHKRLAGSRGRSVSPRTSTLRKRPKAPRTRSSRTIPPTLSKTCHALAGWTGPVLTLGPDLAAHSSREVRPKLWTRSCGSMRS